MVCTRMGIDPGERRTAVAVVEIGPVYRVRYSRRLANATLRDQLELLIARYGVSQVVLERTLARKDRRLRAIRLFAAELKGWLEQRLPVLYLPACSFAEYFDRRDLGWRQALTGLRAPSEHDVIIELRRRARQGELRGSWPPNPHIADAIGMAIYPESAERQ